MLELDVYHHALSNPIRHQVVSVDKGQRTDHICVWQCAQTIYNSAGARLGDHYAYDGRHWFVGDQAELMAHFQERR
jgi:hypothetical protein